MKRADDIFRLGVDRWRRVWTAPEGNVNGGHYRWHAETLPAIAWCAKRTWLETMGGGKALQCIYRVALDGRALDEVWPTLAEAMTGAAIAWWKVQQDGRAA